MIYTTMTPAPSLPSSHPHPLRHYPRATWILASRAFCRSDGTRDMIKLTSPSPYAGLGPLQDITLAFRSLTAIHMVLGPSRLFSPPTWVDSVGHFAPRESPEPVKMHWLQSG